jgi:DNA modification methylase
VAVTDQCVTDAFAMYNGDSTEVMGKLKKESVHMTLYSPPFARPGGGALYSYSSSERDLSNSRTYEEFFEHYGFIVQEIARVTKPGRISAVHCTDVPTGNTGRDHMKDFPGDIIRLHEKLGFNYVARYAVWKDPFVVYLRTLQKNLRHRTVVEDSSKCSCAAADYLLIFRKHGENAEPIAHPEGLLEYAGARKIPSDVLKYRGWTGKQTENKYSQWIWRQYASAFWDDIRLERVLPFRDSKEPDDEQHVHALQLDVVERCVVLWSNPGDVVLSPFAGVGSELYGAVVNGRKAIGIELKPSYYKQAIRNLKDAVDNGWRAESSKQSGLFEEPKDGISDTTMANSRAERFAGLDELVESDEEPAEATP